jgi:hypothetical protein
MDATPFTRVDREYVKLAQSRFFMLAMAVDVDARAIAG